MEKLTKEQTEKLLTINPTASFFKKIELQEAENQIKGLKDLIVEKEKEIKIIKETIRLTENN